MKNKLITLLLVLCLIAPNVLAKEIKPKPKGCNPACAAGYKCVNGECTWDAEPNKNPNGGSGW